MFCFNVTVNVLLPRHRPTDCTSDPRVLIHRKRGVKEIVHVFCKIYTDQFTHVINTHLSPANTFSKYYLGKGVFVWDYFARNAVVS